MYVGIRVPVLLVSLTCVRSSWCGVWWGVVGGARAGVVCCVWCMRAGVWGMVWGGVMVCCVCGVVWCWYVLCVLCVVFVGVGVCVYVRRGLVV